VPNSEETHQGAQEKMSWQTRSRKTHAEEFLARPNAARPQLGAALRSIWDWAVRAWMLSLTPRQSLVKSNLKKWGLTATAQCDCGHGNETFLHQQLHCHLTHRRNMKQTAHNNVAKVIENQVQHINAETRNAQWDRKVLTFLTHSANANTLKVSNHSARSPKRKINELLKPFDNTTSSQRPDGLIEDTKLKHIYIIEVARTDDSPDSLLRVHVKKMSTYNSLLHALRRAFLQYMVKQQNYVIGIHGSINEQQWRQQLTELGMNSHQQDMTIQKCIAASIRGTHAVASSSEKQGNDG